MLVSVHCSIRGYSTVWRNAQNRVVKQVIYSPDLVFKEESIYEKDRKVILPYGWTYTASLKESKVQFNKSMPLSNSD